MGALKALEALRNKAVFGYSAENGAIFEHNGDTIEVLEPYVNCIIPSVYTIEFDGKGNMTIETIFGIRPLSERGPMRIIEHKN